MTWKDQIAPKQIFSQKTTKKIFMYLLVPFLSRINKKKNGGEIQSEKDTIPFLFQNHQIALNTIRFLSEKPLI